MGKEREREGHRGTQRGTETRRPCESRKGLQKVLTLNAELFICGVIISAHVKGMDGDGVPKEPITRLFAGKPCGRGVMRRASALRGRVKQKE